VLPPVVMHMPPLISISDRDAISNASSSSVSYEIVVQMNESELHFESTYSSHLSAMQVNSSTDN
jgi:hypothetical protein